MGRELGEEGLEEYLESVQALTTRFYNSGCTLLFASEATLLGVQISRRQSYALALQLSVTRAQGDDFGMSDYRPCLD